MWPNAKISVMGGEQAANVLFSLDAANRRKRGEAEVYTLFFCNILNNYIGIYDTCTK